MTSRAATPTIRRETGQGARPAILLSTISLVCGASWLMLLVATNFTPWTISVGLLAGVYALGRAER